MVDLLSSFKAHQVKHAKLCCVCSIGETTYVCWPTKLYNSIFATIQKKYPPFPSIPAILGKVLKSSYIFLVKNDSIWNLPWILRTQQYFSFEKEHIFFTLFKFAIYFLWQNYSKREFQVKCKPVTNDKLKGSKYGSKYKLYVPISLFSYAIVKDINSLGSFAHSQENKTVSLKCRNSKGL